MRQLGLEIGGHLQAYKAVGKWVVRACLLGQIDRDRIVMGDKANRPRLTIARRAVGSYERSEDPRTAQTPQHREIQGGVQDG